MNVRQHPIAPREAGEISWLVDVTLFIEDRSRRIGPGQNFVGTDLHSGIIFFEAGTADLVGITQGQELPGSEVVLEILLGFFVAIDLHISDGEKTSVGWRCVPVARNG